MRMQRQAFVAVLLDIMILWSGRSEGVDVNCCIRKVLEMMEKFMLDFFCNRVSLLDAE